jgi:hypothetical protein
VEQQCLPSPQAGEHTQAGTILLAFQFKTPEWVIGIASAALTASAATPPLILINHRLAIVPSSAIAPDSSGR